MRSSRSFVGIDLSPFHDEKLRSVWGKCFPFCVWRRRGCRYWPLIDGMGEKISSKNQGESAADALLYIESHRVGPCQGYQCSHKKREHKSFYENRHHRLMP